GAALGRRGRAGSGVCALGPPGRRQDGIRPGPAGGPGGAGRRGGQPHLYADQSAPGPPAGGAHRRLPPGGPRGDLGPGPGRRPGGRRRGGHRVGRAAGPGTAGPAAPRVPGLRRRPPPGGGRRRAGRCRPGRWRGGGRRGGRRGAGRRRVPPHPARSPRGSLRKAPGPGRDGGEQAVKRVLGIDTAGSRLAVGAWSGDGAVVDVAGRESLEHSRRLVTAVAEVLERAGWSPEQVDLIAVSRGPGSYTGLRLGAMVAKTLGWAVGAPLVGVDSLAVLAANAAGACDAVVAALPARRGRLYARAYRLAAGGEAPGIPAAPAPDALGPLEEGEAV